MNLNETALELHKKGLAVIPVDGKRPITNNWQKLKDENRKKPNGNFEGSRATGVGVVLGHKTEKGYLMAIDVDCYVKEISNELCNQIGEMIGEFPFRVGKKPKFLIPVYCTRPMKKTVSNKYIDTNGKENRVEILAEGQQFVAYGKYGTTGKYNWYNGDLINSDIPVVEPDFIHDVISLFEYMAVQQGLVADNLDAYVESTRETYDRLDISDKEIIEHMQSLDPSKMDHDTWFHVMAGLHHQTDGSPEGLLLFKQWSARDDRPGQYDARLIETKWASLGNSDSPITFASVIAMSRENLTVDQLLANFIAELEDVADTIEANAKTEDTFAVEDAPVVEYKDRFFTGTEFTQLITPANWLIKNMFERDNLIMMYGGSGVGKSYAVIDMALSIAHGLEYHGHDTKQGTVVYMAGEGARGIGSRMAAWHQERNVYPTDNILITSRITDFSSDEDVKATIREIRQREPNPSLIILDTLARASGALDENSTKDMNSLVKLCDVMRHTLGNCSIMIVHHTGKHDSQSARGSSVLRAAMDVEMRLAPLDQGVIELSSTKMKESEPFTPILFGFKTVNLPMLDADGENVRSAVLVEIEQDSDTNSNRVSHTPASETALNALKDLYNKGDFHAYAHPELTQTMGLDAPSECVEYAVFRDEFVAQSTMENMDSKRKAAKRGVDRLVKMDLIIVRDDLLFPTKLVKF